jgi:hypothetical protein
MAMGLTTSLWVSAQVRLCDRRNMPAYVARRGDPDVGSVLIKVVRFAAGTIVYAAANALTEGPTWTRATGPQAVPEADADAYITRQVARDPDLWVLEIEDRHSAWEPDGRVL